MILIEEHKHDKTSLADQKADRDASSKWKNEGKGKPRGQSCAKERRGEFLKQ